MNKSVFVIVPSFNEGKVIRATVQPLLRLGYSVVVVDDHSSDDTQNVLSTMPVHILRHPINLGQGAALQTGMDYALRQGAEFIVHFDADGQHRPEDIEALVKPLRDQQADVALGSRFLRAEDVHHVPFVKRVVLKGGIVINGLVTGLWLTDAHNGFRALTRDAATKIHLRENRFAHASEILSQIRQLGFRYIEVPTTIFYSPYSMAKGQSVWNAFNILVDLLLRRILG